MHVTERELALEPAHHIRYAQHGDAHFAQFPAPEGSMGFPTARDSIGQHSQVVVVGQYAQAGLQYLVVYLQIGFLDEDVVEGVLLGVMGTVSRHLRLRVRYYKSLGGGRVVGQARLRGLALRFYPDSHGEVVVVTINSWSRGIERSLF